MLEFNVSAMLLFVLNLFKSILLHRRLYIDITMEINETEICIQLNFCRGFESHLLESTAIFPQLKLFGKMILLHVVTRCPNVELPI